MSISIFLARVLGLHLIIMGFLYLGRRHFIEKIFSDFFDNNSLIVVTGFLGSIIGLLIVVGHNKWEWNWTLTITLLGYLTLLKALIRLFVPGGGYRTLALKLCRGSAPIFIGIICLIIGLFLVYEGFIGG